MSRKLYTIMMAAALFASVFGLSPLAAAAAGTGPDDALAPTGQWTALAVNQQAWYAFRYEGDGSQVLVRMSVEPSNSATFEVWTPDQLRQWARGDSVTPVGRGSASDVFGGDLVWAGSFNTPGTYYIIVKQTGQTPANYSLQISGTAVGFLKVAAPTSAAPAAVTGAPAAAPAATTKPAVEAKSGKSPADALTPTGQWMPLAVGQQTWYAFFYSGDGSRVVVRMSLAQSNSATFAVWTPGDPARAAYDNTVQPVGRGSVNNALGGDLVWAGSFNTPGTYYVVVTQTGPAPANYLLAIN
jgi:hypothetical protein